MAADLWPLQAMRARAGTVEYFSVRVVELAPAELYYKLASYKAAVYRRSLLGSLARGVNYWPSSRLTRAACIAATAYSTGLTPSLHAANVKRACMHALDKKENPVSV